MILDLVYVAGGFVGLLLLAFAAAQVPLRRCDRCLAALECNEWLSGLVISERAGVPLHAVYRALDALEDEGLVTSELRPGGPERGGRPRRFCRITDEGLDALVEMEEEL